MPTTEPDNGLSWNCCYSGRSQIPIKGEKTLLNQKQRHSIWFSNRLPCQPTAAPAGLKIKPPRDSIHIQQLPSDVKPRTTAAFHRCQIHLAKRHSASGYKLLAKGATPHDRQTLRTENLHQVALRFGGKVGPAAFPIHSSQLQKCLPKPSRKVIKRLGGRHGAARSALDQWSHP